MIITDIGDMIYTALEPMSLPIARDYISKDILKEQYKTDEYITYNIYSERPDTSADDGVITEKCGFYVNIFTHKADKKNQYKNYAVSLLRKADVGVLDIEFLYEKDTEYHHIVIDCEYKREVEDDG